VCTAFTFAGVSDFDRQLHMLRMMGDMMHDGHASNRTGNNRNKSSSSGTGTGKDGEALMQRKSSKQANMLGHLKVDLTIISNITSWHAVRVVLHRFGTTFRNRMMMNTSYVVMVSILLLVWLVAVTFSNVDNPDALLSIFIRCSQVIVWALFFLLYLLQNIFKGYLINREYLNHAHQLRRSHIAFNAYVAEEEIQMKTQELGLASSAADEANHLNSAVGRRLIKRQQQQREELEAAVLPGTVVVDHDHKGKDIDSLRIVSADAESTAITATETTVTPLEVEPVQVIGAAMSLAERELFILKLKHAMALLRALAESLTIDYETVPQKLLGIPCSIQLISAMLSVTATALAAIASVLGQAFSEQM
jgi:hypothetical protein